MTGNSLEDRNALLSPQNWQRLQMGGLLLLCLSMILILIRTAWLCDDAYISYRAVDNVVNGFGPTFNPAERVQAYTHPLWMWLHVPFRAIFQDMFVLGIAMSMCFSLAAMGLAAWRLTDDLLKRAWMLLLLMCSTAFVEYSSSGLENPMTHLLIAGFVMVWTGGSKGHRRLFLLSLIAALALCNRMDSILLMFPALAVEAWRQRSWRAVGVAVCGFSPFIIWEMFSVIYYGFPFPNTAYAKLGTGLDSGTIWAQGGYYFANSFLRDPITLLTVLAGIVLPFVLRNKKLWPLSIGIFIYLMYILRIGGDFMSGRFFTAPFFLAVIVLVQLEWRLPNWAKGLAFALPLLLFFHKGWPDNLSGKSYAPDTASGELIDSHGIANERAFYYPFAGLLHAPDVYGTGKEMPTHRWRAKGEGIALKTNRFAVDANMGFMGFFAGPECYLVDRFGLTDPFLARLPQAYRPDWRPGHYMRLLPTAYPARRLGLNDRLLDPKLDTLYQKLEIVTQGPIWTKERWAEIWNFNTGKYKQLVDRERYILPAINEKSLSELSTVLPDSSQWKVPGATEMRKDSGLLITAPMPPSGHYLDLSLRDNCRYLLVFRDGEKITHSEYIAQGLYDGLLRKSVSLEAAREAGKWDNMALLVINMYRKGSVGHFRFLPGPMPAN